MFVIAILGPLILAVIVTSGVVACSPAAGNSWFANALWRSAPWIPPMSLLLVWGIAIGTRLATGSWPEPCGIVVAAGGIVEFVGNPPDGYWGLLRFFAQLALASTVGILLGLPVVLFRRWLTPAHNWASLGWRRISGIVVCAAAIVASYSTLPGRSALDWIID